jgi:DNA polymerase
MSESGQTAYLQAMEIPVWINKTTQQENPSPQTAISVNDLNWEQLADRVKQCQQCELSRSRQQTVFGTGDLQAELMIIGEAPGAEEDRQGQPFVGRAGQLLTNMLQAIGLDRTQVYIANILKCRPPSNRDPQPTEVIACSDYLNRQIALIQPRLILSVGGVSAKNLLQTDQPVGRLRGKIHQYKATQTDLIVTYHPAYLLRRPEEKSKTWKDLQQVMSHLSHTAV